MAVRIADLPKSMRPRERLWKLGPRVLSEVELLALVVGTGRPGRSAMDLAACLVSSFGGLRGLASAEPEELSAQQGVGPAKAATILAALHLGRQANRPDHPVPIAGPEQLADVACRELEGLRRENVLALVLDSGHRLIRTVSVSSGSSDRCLLPKREILNAVLRNDGVAFAIAHNHPSGDPTPSRMDLEATRDLAEAAHAVGLRFLDHLVVADTRWESISRYDPSRR